MEENNKIKKEDNRKRLGTVNIILFIILFTALVAVGAVCAKLYIERQDKELETVDKTKVSGSSIVVSDDSRNYAGEIASKAEKGKIVVRMTQNWVFEDGGKSSNAYLANSKRNSYDLRFRIYLKDTEEVIMTSPIVPVGSCIENFSLDVSLDPGTYDVIVAHEQIENSEVINSVHTAVAITVK